MKLGDDVNLRHHAAPAGMFFPPRDAAFCRSDGSATWIYVKLPQVRGDQLPSALRQAAPRTLVSRPSTVSVWEYCRQFWLPT